jgi:hypothetical protein
MSEIQIRNKCENCAGTREQVDPDYHEWERAWVNALTETNGAINKSRDIMRKNGFSQDPPLKVVTGCPACSDGYKYEWVEEFDSSIEAESASKPLMRQRKRAYYTTSYIKNSKPPTSLGQSIRDFGLKHKLENSVALGARLGVSGTTVSRILNGKHLVGRTTVERVLTSMMPQAVALTQKYFDNHNKHAMSMEKTVNSDYRKPNKV